MTFANDLFPIFFRMSLLIAKTKEIVFRVLSTVFNTFVHKIELSLELCFDMLF